MNVLFVLVLTSSLLLGSARISPGAVKDLARIRSLLEESRGQYGDSDEAPETCPHGLNFGGRSLTPVAEVSPVPPDELAMAFQVDPATGYYLNEAKPGLFILSDGTYIIMFAVTEVGVVLFDCPGTLGEKIRPAIESVTEKPLTHVVYSHVHQDHIGGCGAVGFGNGVEVIAHANTAASLALFQDPNRPLATTTFEEEYKASIGGLDIELSKTPDGHTDGDLFIYLPAYKTVNVVDVAYAGWIPFRSVAISDDFSGYLETLEQLLTFDADLYVLGHLTRTGTREDVLEFQEFMLDLKVAAMGALANDSAVLAEAVQRFGATGNGWLIFNELGRAREDTCFDALKPKWAGRLAGFDVYTRSHCTVVLDFLTIE